MKEEQIFTQPADPNHPWWTQDEPTVVVNEAGWAAQPDDGYTPAGPYSPGTYRMVRVAGSNEPTGHRLLRELWDALGWQWGSDERTPKQLWEATLVHLALHDIRFPPGGP